MIFRHTYTPNSFTFYFQDNQGNKVPVNRWNELNVEFLSQLAILNELNDNGIADYHDETCEVDGLIIAKLEELDRRILDLPEHYPFEILIERDGVLHSKELKFRYGFYDFCPNGTILRARRDGIFLSIDTTVYLLTENQYLICEAIDEFNNLEVIHKGDVINFRKLSELKQLSKSGGLTLEQFLSNQEIFLPDKIKLDINFTEGYLEILPTVGIDNPQGFTTSYDNFRDVKGIYPITGNEGKSTRVILTEGQKEELLTLKELRRVSDKTKIEEIVEHPELFFDDDEVDFSVFYSDRVKEIGIYKPKFYAFVSPYKSQWIPGIIIKDKIIGEKKIYFKSPDILSDFIQQYEIASKENKNSFEWENVEIPMDKANDLIKSAKRQFESPREPIIKERPTDLEVLIIKENAEILEFVNTYELPETLKHNFSGIPNLRNNIQLKEHQKEGISWLQSLYKENLSGGLLADDMGLGKTLQLLYFIEWHSQFVNIEKPYLIVAPVSLLENWENEYSKFFSPCSLRVLKLYGIIDLTKENNLQKNQQDALKLQTKQIILTNYETVRSYQLSIGLVDFAIIALDEAQKIKTPGTLIENAAKALKADFKIAMTGTPVENTLIDIWSLMDFTVSGLLGNAKDFYKEYQKPLNDEGTDIKELTERLRNNIGFFIKRRLKIDVADLPKKHDGENSRFKKIMPPIQLDRYKQEIEEANNSTLEGIEKRNQKLKSIWAIRDISDHPFLLESQILNFTSEELVNSSSKLQTTVGILEEIKIKGEKVILFADRKETQKMLQKIGYDIFGIFASIINGDTPSSQQIEGKSKLSRQQTIDRFQAEKGFNIIIMSPIAAGVGLNVTEANHIIHYTRHWNPAKEDQATDRAYRIGQNKEVYVYYPMAIFPEEMKDEEGNRMKSFDEILDVLLANKKALASNTLFPTDQAEITPDELFGNIFGSKVDSKPSKLVLEDIDRLNPNLFEACIAALYKKQGFDIRLTPYSNDKGADVVILKSNDNYLIQVKQTKSLVGNEAIQEINTAKNYYQNLFKVEFKLIAITNNDFSSSAKTLALANCIKLLDRNDLKDMINNYDISLMDINKLESQRMTRV
jgi:SNF2 family DNA or RNA helicase/HJR/Mrr/RecB family endonuclease